MEYKAFFFFTTEAINTLWISPVQIQTQPKYQCSNFVFKAPILHELR